MTLLESLRRKQEKSKSRLAGEANLNPATITYAEQRGFRLYPQQLEKLAAALGWEGDPELLLEEVA